MAYLRGECIDLLGAPETVCDTLRKGNRARVANALRRLAACMDDEPQPDEQQGGLTLAMCGGAFDPVR